MIQIVLMIIGAARHDPGRRRHAGGAAAAASRAVGGGQPRSDLIRPAVAEVAPATSERRLRRPVAREDIPSTGTSCRPELMLLSTLSAMRDETVYARPDTFDIGAPTSRASYPVFGGGAHRCIGEALARVELEEGLGALLRLPRACADRRDAGPPRPQRHPPHRRAAGRAVMD